MAGEGGFAFEPGHSGGFADDFGCSQLRAARDFQQCGGDLVDSGADALGQGVDLAGEPDDVGQLGAREFGDQSWLGVQPGPQGLLVLGGIERACCRCPLGIEFMDEPAQPVDRRRALGHKDISTVSQPLQLPRRLVVGGQG